MNIFNNTQEQIKGENDEPPLPPVKDFNDWHWQVRNSITSLEELSKYITLTDEEKIDSPLLKLRITPYYARLLSTAAIRKCVVPTTQELNVSPCEAADSLAEERDRKTPNIIHRYPDRILFLVTNLCTSNCRYCTRSRLIDNPKHSVSHEWKESFEYIRNHPEVRDVLISGGDPLMLSDQSLDYLLKNLYAIPTVEIVRIGTKIPIVLPMRITDGLISVLEKYSPLYINIHATHPAEITPEATQALLALSRRGHAVLGSQTVCLAGINDSAEVLGELFKSLLRISVKPLYLYNMDLVPGSSHFRVPISKILEIMRELIGKISGLSIPHFVCDLPGGGGKTPLVPNYIEKIEGNEYYFKNWNNKSYRFIDQPYSPVKLPGGGETKRCYYPAN